MQSALDQSYRSFEIIVTDDSNSSDIKSICDACQDPRIRYRTNPVNLGVALNLRTATQEAQGSYIAILNDDDAWEPEFLEKLVVPLEQDPNRVLAFSDHWIMSESGQIHVQKTDDNTAHYGRSTLPAGDVADLADVVLEKNGVPLAMASMFRKDAIDWNLLVKEVSGAYDFWISCLLAATNRPAYYVAERLTRYRIHGAMETVRRAPDKSENMVFIYRNLLDRNAFSNKRSLLTSRYALALYSVGRDVLFFNRASEAQPYFRNSLKIAASKKALASLLISYFPRPLRKALKFSS